MKRLNYFLVVLGLASICLSILACYWVWASREYEESFSTYLVEANSSDYYRIYVLVNRKTVVADEDVGIRLYSVSLKAGDKIEIHGYSEESFTVTLETEGLPLASENDYIVSISYDVP